MSTTTVANSTEERLAYGVHEVARRFGVTEQHVKNLIRRGEVSSFQLGARRLISAAEVERLMKEGTAPTAVRD